MPGSQCSSMAPVLVARSITQLNQLNALARVLYDGSQVPLLIDWSANMSESESPFRMEPAEGGFRFSLDLLARTAERQTKVATFGKFTIHCDEGAAIGGDDAAPPPLAYFAASVAF